MFTHSGGRQQRTSGFTGPRSPSLVYQGPAEYPQGYAPGTTRGQENTRSILVPECTPGVPLWYARSRVYPWYTPVVSSCQSVPLVYPCGMLVPECTILTHERVCVCVCVLCTPLFPVLPLAERESLTDSQTWTPPGETARPLCPLSSPSAPSISRSRGSSKGTAATRASSASECRTSG